MTNFWLKRQYAEVSQEPDGLSKRGYVYLLSEFLTFTGNETIRLGFNTNSVSVAFQFYDMISTITPIRASLYEAPTITSTTSTIVPRNLNRNEPDDSTITLLNVTTRTGGTNIASELIGVGTKAGGLIASQKIHILKPETVYVMEFANTQNQASLFHINLGWSEREPLPQPLWEPA